MIINYLLTVLAVVFGGLACVLAINFVSDVLKARKP